MNDHVFQIYIIVYRFTVRWFGDTAILGGIPDDGSPKIFRFQDENQNWKSNGCHNMPNKQNKSWKCMSKYLWIIFCSQHFFQDIHRHQSGFVLVFNMMKNAIRYLFIWWNGEKITNRKHGDFERRHVTGGYSHTWWTWPRTHIAISKTVRCREAKSYSRRFHNWLVVTGTWLLLSIYWE